MSVKLYLKTVHTFHELYFRLMTADRALFSPNEKDSQWD